MYIGAWTEYRLAQEHVQHRREISAQHADSGTGSAAGNRKASGIYHLSLPDKGGMEVAGLPDRESFRRTLELALSSNLAADDAENISQALEPLMQRLPTLHATAAATVNRRRQTGGMPLSTRNSRQQRCHRQKRKGADHRNWALNKRCGGRRTGSSSGLHTHSDVGPQSGRLSTSDGTRSTLSGFSTASAPLNTAAALEERRARSMGVLAETGLGQQHQRDRPGEKSRMPQLPLIVDTRRRQQWHPQNSRQGCSNRNHRGNSTGLSRQGTPTSANEHSKPCRDGNGGGDPSRSRPPTGFGPAVDGNSEEEMVASAGGYNGGATAAILRMARRRDPAGLKANFEQFWRWKRRATVTSTSTNTSKRCPSATERRSSAGAAAASKLETLERMKTVYMAKEDTGSGCSPAANAADPPTESNAQEGPSRSPRPPGGAPGITPLGNRANNVVFSGSVRSKLPGGTGDEMDITRQEDRGDYDVTKTFADDTGSTFDHGEAAVNIPDLELTESRIRQVEKYFGGGSGRLIGGGAGRRHGSANEETELLQEHAVNPAASEGSSWAPQSYPDGAAAAGNFAEKDENASAAVHSAAGGIGDGGGSDSSQKGDINNSASSSADCDAERLRPRREEGSSSLDGVIGFAEAPGGWEGSHAGVFSPATITEEAAVAARRQQEPLPPEPYRKGSIGTHARNGIGVVPGCGVMSASEEGLSPLDRKIGDFSAGFGLAAPSPAAAAVAPAWCADSSSLEDLVYWTRGLDYDAAVKGF